MSIFEPKRIWSVLERLYLNSLAERMRSGEGWTVLWGHGVCSELFQCNEDGNHILFSVFREQMKYILSRGYTFISMSEAVDRLRKGQPMRKLVTLTFDDGFRNVIDAAYPLMREWNLKGCLYVVGGYADSNRTLWTDMVSAVCWYRHSRHEGALKLDFPKAKHSFRFETAKDTLSSIKIIKKKLRSMPESSRLEYFRQIELAFASIPDEFMPKDYEFASWDRLRSVDANVLEIGNHSWSHPNLANVDEAEQLYTEVQRPKVVLEEKLQRKVAHFCYPAGSYNARVIDVVRQCGHESAVTIIPGLNRTNVSPFELRRIELTPEINHFKARASGLEPFLLSLKRGLNSGLSMFLGE